MDILIGLGIFTATVLLIEGGYYAFRGIRNPDKRRVRQRLKSHSFEGYGNGDVDIVRKTSLSDVPWLNKMLLKFQWTKRMNRLLKQADTHYPLGFFVLLTLLLAFVGYLGGFFTTTNSLAPILLAASLAAIPLLYLYGKKNSRMKKFQRQLPEALELVARALKAGHAFSGGLKMVADEFADPAGPEFDRTLDEINFGVSTNEALKNLSERIDCPDLKFFVISVILQRETGGNLAEILENIAYIIRERFKFQGHIRTLSAEGKFSALILIAMPFVVAFILSLLNPRYVATLFTDPLGKFMVGSAITMMILGVLVIRKMIQIRV